MKTHPATRHRYVCWTPTVHRIAAGTTQTACGLTIPRANEPRATGQVGYYGDGYDETHRGFCSRCRRAAL